MNSRERLKSTVMGKAVKRGRRSDGQTSLRVAFRSVTTMTVLSLAYPATAQTIDTSVTIASARLELTLPKECGTPEFFVDRVRVRSDRIRFHPDETRLLVIAEISARPNGIYAGEMTIKQPDGTSATRRIESSRCSQTIDGLALLIALTLDPSSVTRTTPSAPPPSPPQSVTKSPPTPTAEPRTPEPPTPEPPKPFEPVTDEASYWSVSMTGSGLRGPAPGWLLGGEVAVQWTWQRRSLLSPTFRVGVSKQQKNDFAATGGVADFDLLAATFYGCPFAFGLGPLEFRGCAVTAAGRLSTTGRKTLEPETHRRPWVAFGLGPELDAVLAENVAITARAYAAIPVTRDSYQFEPATFYHTPSSTFGIIAGLSVRFR